VPNVPLDDQVEGGGLNLDEALDVEAAMTPVGAGASEGGSCD